MTASAHRYVCPLSLAVVLLGSACATPRTQVRVAYTATTLPAVSVEATNDTGHDLPMPQEGLIAQAVQLITGKGAVESSVAEAFADAAQTRLAERNVRVVSAAPADGLRLRVRLTDWDVHDGAATGAVVFVSADYQLVDAHDTVLWEVVQDRLPMRLTGPNLSRFAVERIADSCLDRAFASLPGASPSGR